MAKIISVFNNKGSVGKTTSCWNLAHAMGNMGKRTLLIDFDPQCNPSIAVLGENTFVNMTRKAIKRHSAASRYGFQPGFIATPKLITKGNLINLAGFHQPDAKAGTSWYGRYIAGCTGQ